MKETNAQTVIEKLKEAVYFSICYKPKNTTESLFTEMLNGTTSVKSEMAISFTTIEIEAVIVAQVASQQSLYKRTVKQWLNYLI